MGATDPVAPAEKDALGRQIVVSETSRKTSSDDAPASVRAHEIEGVRVLGLTDEEAAFVNNFDRSQRVKLNRKIDWRLIPLFSALQIMNFLDRVNIGNAKIEGMDVDLQLTGVQYNVALCIFFISYILMEIPSNIILKQIPRPSWYLGGMGVGFGIVSMCTGFVQNFSGLAGLRFVLGIFEAGFLPAVLFLFSVWYTPDDLATRISYIVSGAGTVSGAFGGLLAAAITQMDGMGGIEGWRWIFILEGLMTVIVAIISGIFLIDLPSPTMKWLDPAELRYLEIQRRIKQGGLQADGSDTEGGELGFGGLYELKMVATDWRMWFIAVVLICSSSGIYGGKFALPTITQAMGFSSTNAQLLSSPPYLAGGAAGILISWFSDRYQHRALFVAGSFVLVLISNCVIISFQGELGGRNLAASYTFNIISMMGIYGAAPVLLAWASSNIAPAGRRAIIAAWMVSWGNIAGIVGSFMYMDSERPVYNTGFGLQAGFSLLGIVGSGILWYVWRKENRSRDQYSEEQVKAMFSDKELLRLGNKSLLFRNAL